ncbi:MAG TPA: metalloregulator ArsR/SmtB family transcription factor [Gemmataceae bacterium]|jgi:DNA-binding transcriptional ArsR family regulator|nr:metalloregulator ArsR/SmtB family transcription factor [Gemmataceae bacterium]
MDAFNAIAEMKRRRVLEALRGNESSVSEIVAILNWPQPQVSKHLGVLRKVGLVGVRRDGRRKLYRVHAERLKPIYDWAASFEAYWQDQLDRIKKLAESKVKTKP